jgi:hypothetical protein
MSDAKVALASDPKTAEAITAVRTRIGERISAILDDLEILHQTVAAARPLTHSAEAFEALEQIDTEAWEALDALRTVMARCGFLPARTR